MSVVLVWCPYGGVCALCTDGRCLEAAARTRDAARPALEQRHACPYCDQPCAAEVGHEACATLRGR